MNFVTKEQRIDVFKKLIGPYITQSFTNYLIDIGFFTAPASIHRHGTYEGGLFDHSLAVTETLTDLTKRLSLKWDMERSPYVVGLFHDLCKLDNYQRKAGTATAWEHRKSPILTGHGEKSVIMLQQWMKLTLEELLCIRWHMGAFDDKANWDSYSGAVTVCPNVLYTHTADMIADRILGV